MQRIFLPWLLVLAACGSEKPAAPEPAPIHLRVMSFNIEWGGTHVSFDKVVEAIRRADPDIVGIQEAEGNLQALADALGWHYELRNYVVSKYPLIEPPDADGKYLYVEVAPGRMVALANVHLPSDPYGPDRVRDGAPPEEVLELERRVRLPGVRTLLDALSGHIAAGVPLFMTGDFNAPSHEDWTEAMVGRRPFLRYALDWPVSRAVSAAGFRDAWRAVYPDPLTNPGLTWWASRPPLELYTPGENDAQDRIDFIWYAGDAEVTACRLLGEQDGPEVSIAVTPWPSDHRGVVADFSVLPAAMPLLVSPEQRVYRHGQDIGIVYRKAGGAVVRVRRLGGGEPRVLVEATVRGDGRLTLPADEVAAGHYEVQLLEAEAGPLRKDFWVQEPGATPAIAVAASRFDVGQPIAFRWQNGPGHRNDYVAVFEAGTDAGYENSLAWTYVQALPEGELQLDAVTSEGLPLPSGRYVLRLMKDDGYEPLAESSAFEVR